MKTYIITLGFVPARIWEKCCKRVYDSRNKDLEIEHLFLYQHYPLEKDENKKRLQEICDIYGIHWLDAGKNLGLHKGFNFVLEQLRCRLNHKDVIIGLDPDTYPLSPGWDMALVTCFQNPRVGWASLMSERAKPELLERGFDEKMIGHQKVWFTKKPVVNSICAWSWGFLNTAGGLKEPREYYGGLEADMWIALKKQNLDWVFTVGWEEDDRLRNEQDHLYKVWKWRYSHELKTKKDFATWLKEDAPGDEAYCPEKIP